MIIDLHQDIVLSHKSRVSFEKDFPSERKLYNAWNQQQYADIDLVVWAIWPYQMQWDPMDHENRTITPDTAMIEQGVASYRDIFGDRVVLGIANMQASSTKCLIHIEWYDAMESIGTIRDRFSMGVRSFGFCRNFDNTLAWCAVGEWTGLTPLGYQVIELMNELGMMVDTAHMSHEAMMDVIRHTTQPLINSHSNIYAVHHHPRNVQDERLRLLPHNGGCVGLSVYEDFVWWGWADCRMKHVDHVISLIGSDHVAFGTDFHGIALEQATIGSVDQLSLLLDAITDRYGSSVTRKIMYENAKRVICDVLPH